MSRLVALVLAAALVTAPVIAHAEIQKDGPEMWPGKVMVGVRPLGVQLQFSDAWVGANGTGFVYGVGDRALFKLAIDVAGIIANLSKVTLWLGGEFNVGGRGYLAFLEPGLFVQITLEKLLRFPLVPMVRAGFSGPVYIPYGFGGAAAAGAFQLKFGVGAYYFLTKNIGVGADMDFAFGPGFVRDGNDHLAAGFSGYWDFTAGARFAF